MRFSNNGSDGCLLTRFTILGSMIVDFLIAGWRLAASDSVAWVSVLWRKCRECALRRSPQDGKKCKRQKKKTICPCLLELTRPSWLRSWLPRSACPPAPFLRFRTHGVKQDTHHTHVYFDPLVHLVAGTVFVQIGCATTPQCAERFGDDHTDVRMSVRRSSRVLDHQEHQRHESKARSFCITKRHGRSFEMKRPCDCACHN